MSLGDQLVQDVLDAGPHAHRRVGGDAELLRDPVGDRETDAGDVDRHPVGVIFEHGHRAGTILAEYPHSVARTDAVTLEEYHHLAYLTLFAP